MNVESSLVIGSRLWLVVMWGVRLVGEVVDGGLVGAVGGSESGRDWWVGVGDFGESGAQESVVGAGEEAARAGGRCR